MRGGGVFGHANLETAHLPWPARTSQLIYLFVGRAAVVAELQISPAWVEPHQRERWISAGTRSRKPASCGSSERNVRSKPKGRIALHDDHRTVVARSKWRQSRTHPGHTVSPTSVVNPTPCAWRCPKCCAICDGTRVLPVLRSVGGGLFSALIVVQPRARLHDTSASLRSRRGCDS